VVWGLLIIEILIVAVGLALWFKPRPIAATVTASIAVLVGMWLERWNIVVPTMTHPYLVPYATYHPSLTEISLTAASFAIFILMFVVFFKLFPVISIWEVSEGRVIEASRAKVTIPMPELSTELSASQRIRLGR
jgi:molybdopterin-containing oxidoreductase family membrane subunit